MYPAKFGIKDTTESNNSAIPTSITPVNREGLSYTTKVAISTSVFDITKFPFLSSNIPSSPAYGAFISHNSYNMPGAGSSYDCLILKATSTFISFFGQTYVGECLKSSFKKFYCRYGDLINNMKSPSAKYYMIFWSMTICSDTFRWSDITFSRYLVTELYLITDFDIIDNLREVSIEHIQRERLANGGCFHYSFEHLVLSHLGTCVCSNFETSLSWTCQYICFGLFLGFCILL